MDNKIVEQVAREIERARSVLFITGAGISADSGLPTYRGVGGLYNGRTTDEGMPIEVAMSGEMFARRPELTWKHILEIERACRGRSFNRGHEVIAELEALPSKRVWTLTQNVDGFHRKAGARNIIDIHGDVHQLMCTACDWSEVVDDYTHLSEELPPRCPYCQAVIRPNVILFGEQLPQAQLADYHRELQRGFDLLVSIGTTSAFPYIAYPMLEAVRDGKPTVEINPGETELSSSVDFKLASGAARTLAAIAAALA